MGPPGLRGTALASLTALTRPSKVQAAWQLMPERDGPRTPTAYHSTRRIVCDDPILLARTGLGLGTRPLDSSAVVNTMRRVALHQSPVEVRSRSHSPNPASISSMEGSGPFIWNEPHPSGTVLSCRRSPIAASSLWTSRA